VLLCFYFFFVCVFRRDDVFVYYYCVLLHGMIDTDLSKFYSRMPPPNWDFCPPLMYRHIIVLSGTL